MKSAPKRGLGFILIAFGISIGCESGEKSPPPSQASEPSTTAGEGSDKAPPPSVEFEDSSEPSKTKANVESSEALKAEAAPLAESPARAAKPGAKRARRASPSVPSPAPSLAPAASADPYGANLHARREATDKNRDGFADLEVLKDPSLREMTFIDYGVNPTFATVEQATSTFAVDVDSASYNVVRSFLQKGKMPDEAAVRVEEMINAFDYAYSAPEQEPFMVQAEAFPSPNRKGYHVLHVGIKGRELSMDQRKPAALVFVIDVSGSMQGAERLGLVKRSLTMLTRQLDGRDSVSLVVYGSNARTVLAPTRTNHRGKRQIVDAIAHLATEGSTNVEAGLKLGYSIAARQARAGSTSRVILCSDGVANVGSTEAQAILGRVKEQADRGVTISTIGFGMGHYNDVLMERLADKGNGNYAYVDNIESAQRVFVDRLAATLEVIAKDVKVQLVFDKSQVARYRLLGFENRMLEKQDFANDRVDAGELGAGHTVTAIYEVKLRKPGQGKLAALRVRYKAPNGHSSKLLQRDVPGSIVRSSYAEASAPTQLSMVVAGFAEKLRGSYWARNQSYSDILSLWQQLPASLRHRQDVAELRSLIVTANSLDQRADRYADLLPVAKMDFDRVPVLY